MKFIPVSLFLASLLHTLHAEVRTFTSAAGTTIRGELVSVNGDTVTIKKDDGQTLTLKAAAFSRVDQAWLQSQGTQTPAASASATKAAPFVNSLGMKFVPVPGSNVLFCTTLTRLSDYNVFAAEAGLPTIGPPGGEQRDIKLFPVNLVSWKNAHAFCDWLSNKDGKTYRLPTDREWSMAVGVGGQESHTALPEELDGKLKGIYPWGSQWPPPNGFGNYLDETFLEFCKAKKYPLADVIKGYKDGEIMLSPVEAFKPNKLGLHDMGGNLWQWCEDWYDAASTKKLLRGGGCVDCTKERLLSSARWPNEPDFVRTQSNGTTGFRCVLVLPAP